MATAIAFIRWENHFDGVGSNRLFASRPPTYNSSQERLHSLSPGDRLWLVSRCPDDKQYYFTTCFTVLELWQNPVGGQIEQEFGRFAVSADPSSSFDLGKRFPAEGLLRAFEFESGRPIKFGASLGQSIQTIRFLTRVDESILEDALRGLTEEPLRLDSPFGLWSKCDPTFAKYFVDNWQAQQRALAFLLYDSPPVLTLGAPVFIHSDKCLRLVATFGGSQFVAGHKYTVDKEETLEISVRRSCVRNHIGNTKTEGSARPVPLHPLVLTALLVWKKEAGYCSTSDFLFASIRLNGEKPLSPDSILKKSIRPALLRAGIVGKQIGWHNFRHSLATNLRAIGVDLKVAQELLRHANSRTTLDVYTRAVSERKREANEKVVELLLSDRAEMQ